MDTRLTAVVAPERAAEFEQVWDRALEFGRRQASVPCGCCETLRSQGTTWC